MASIPVNHYNRSDIEQSFAAGKLVGFLDACANMQDHPMYYPEFIDTLEVYIKEAFGDEVVNDLITEESIFKFTRKYNLPYELKLVSNPDEPHDQIQVQRLPDTQQAISKMSGVEPMLIRVKWCRQDSNDQICKEVERMHGKGYFTSAVCNRLLARITKLYNMGYHPAVCAHEDDNYHVITLSDANKILSIISCNYRLRRDRKRPYCYYVAKT